MSLPRRFSISIDGKPVVMPREDPEQMPQAKTSDYGDQPAVFEILGGHLISGPFAMGRRNMEDRSLHPKSVVWCTMEHMNELQPVQVEMREDGPELSFNGCRLALIEGQVVCPLIPEMAPSQRVEIRPE
ncbi:hypothetical protein FPOAC2_05826 [Fusarium poae]|uniref:hypothetical protein n=1 Tax=Fusarium poae TaxID=36050 RepID=UPI001CE9EAE5|nr:hypothetical protein FPOAC1_005710 [Fusarium poae]KAG8672438.1 hypothetical protein FPOAC1_005710 [Fusarium poae]